ncbi:MULTISPECIES: AbrB family transcriptional regulator [Corynebacterium]|uniref:AbrB family transcriptional regulator n=1 Tax=Corynebacterium TaxID=1716 RepID=UPI0008A5E39C|nr:MULTISPECIES: AbrB family transcriptional regulator [Corynebacterium]OFT76530.1 ammonia monooxygenase [Corynebacterium sp. HMSC30G07]
MNRWLFVVPASVALGALLSWAHVPAAWILGAIIASGAAALIGKRELEVNDIFFKFARGIIGVMAALPLVGIPPADLVRYLVPGLVSAAFIILLAFGGGIILANHGVSRETGVLSLLAGGASIMPAIAHEVGADVRYVALSQYLRLLVVSFTLPLVASLLGATGDGSFSAQPTEWWMWILVPAMAFVGQPLGKLLRLPNAPIFGPMLLTVLVGYVVKVPVVSPAPVTIAALIAIGWMVGGGLSVPALKLFSRMLPATFLYIIILMAACAGMGWVMSKWLGLTPLEGYLATTPGAIETVLALSAEGGTGPAVITLQLIRLICVVLFAGYLPQILLRLKHQR